MRALDDLSRAIVAAYSRNDLRVVAAVALGQKNVGGPAEILRRLAQGSAWQHVFVAKGSLAVDEDDLETVPHFYILEAIVQNEHIRAEFLDRIDSALHAVAVHQHHDTTQVVCEHEGLITRRAGIQQQGNPVRNHARHEE